MKYERPTIRIVEANAELLAMSDIGGPGATDIGAPDISNECKSVWDEVNDTYNINKEEDYEVYE